MKKTLFVLAAVVLAAANANADERYPVVRDEVVKKECGACHMAYQPQFLPASSWKTIMDGLKDHFGEDASLDDKTTLHITDYLVRNAGRERGAKAPLRITELGWFRDEHEGEVSRTALRRAKTMANCVSCHRGADDGYYDDD